MISEVHNLKEAVKSRCSSLLSNSKTRNSDTDTTDQKNKSNTNQMT